MWLDEMWSKDLNIGTWLVHIGEAVNTKMVEARVWCTHKLGDLCLCVCSICNIAQCVWERVCVCEWVSEWVSEWECVCVCVWVSGWVSVSADCVEFLFDHIFCWLRSWSLWKFCGLHHMKYRTETGVLVGGVLWNDAFWLVDWLAYYKWPTLIGGWEKRYEWSFVIGGLFI